MKAFRFTHCTLPAGCLITLLLNCFPLMIQGQPGALRKADTEYKLHQFDLAIESYSAVLDRDPDNAEAQARIADCYRMTNELENAAKWYAKAITHRKSDPLLVFQYAQVLKSLGEYDKAKRQYLDYGEEYPGFGQHYAVSCDEASILSGTEPLYDVRLEYINSAFSELFPTMHGDEVIFASSRTDIVREDQRLKVNLEEGSENQLFSSGRDEKNFLLKPGFFHPQVRHSKNEGPLSFSEDGKWVAFTRNNFREGIRPIPGSGLELSIYIARVEPDGTWGEARPFPHNGTGYSTGFPCFADQGNTLYFASDRSDGYGGFDLFMSTRADNSWTPPVNLGPVINTPGHELSPYFDGQFLYLASNWHFGLGGFDLFKAAYENGGWKQISNMGTGINSSYDDLSLVYDPSKNFGYLTSNRPGGKGGEDLYHFRTRTETLTFHITDALSKSPLNGATVDLQACGEAVLETDENGLLIAHIPTGLSCRAEIRSLGYAPFSFALNEGSYSGDRRFEIALEREEDRFVGLVTNTRTSRGEPDVVVRLANDLTGEQYEVFTNANGQYTLALAANTTYTMTFSKAGFLNIHKKVSTGTRTDRNLLGTVAMQFLGGGPDNPATSSPSAGTSPVAVETPTPNSGIGYSVQVATVFNLDEVNPKKYEQLREFGNIYNNPEGRTKKIRVGIYTDRAYAEDIQNRINELGFSTAFVVEEPVTDRNRDIILSSAKPRNDAEPATPQTPAASSPVYLVRLATYSRPEFFNPALVEGLGTVERIKKGNMTIMLLRGYDNLPDARQVVTKVLAAGFDTAHIVTLDSDGTIKRVE
jgi:tetratricopeptide (TPR) repeat protein